MAKTATERLNDKKHPKKVVLEKDFAGIKAGTRMLVGTPQMIDNYVRKIPFGETRGIARLRNELARRHRCEAMCPVSTAIFLRVVADAALESLEGGADIAEITPFWRAVGPDDKLVKKLDVDSAWIEHQRSLER
ncbi:MAG: hypothetical protein AAGH76_03080 [Pseudomonadota bacterium]